MGIKAILSAVPGALRAVNGVRSLLHLPPAYPPGYLKPEGTVGIEELGHREYVGGHWEVMRDLQFQFLLSHGLKPTHTLWDIACGSLRAGVPFINYLEAGHYHGVDRHRALLDLGIERELGRPMFELKRPDLIVSERFEFEKFASPCPDFALAQSLFTHLPSSLIKLCLKNLRQFSKADTVFFASFFVVDNPVTNAATPHDHRGFYYTATEMELYGIEHGWKPHYIGDWNHPRPGQVMMAYRLQ